VIFHHFIPLGWSFILPPCSHPHFSYFDLNSANSETVVGSHLDTDVPADDVDAHLHPDVSSNDVESHLVDANLNAIVQTDDIKADVKTDNVDAHLKADVRTDDISADVHAIV
jgi:hypothetical protein